MGDGVADVLVQLKREVQFKEVLPTAFFFKTTIQCDGYGKTQRKTKDTDRYRHFKKWIRGTASLLRPLCSKRVVSERCSPDHLTGVVKVEHVFSYSQLFAMTNPWSQRNKPTTAIVSRPMAIPLLQEMLPNPNGSTSQDREHHLLTFYLNTHQSVGHPCWNVNIDLEKFLQINFLHMLSPYIIFIGSNDLPFLCEIRPLIWRLTAKYLELPFWMAPNKFIRTSLPFANEARSVLLFGYFSFDEENMENNKRANVCCNSVISNPQQNWIHWVIQVSFLLSKPLINLVSG